MADPETGNSVIDSPNSWKDAGNTAVARGDWASAADNYSKGLLLCDATRGGDIRHLLLCNRARANLELQQFQGALLDATECLQISPEWAKAYLWKAVALQRTGQQMRAQAAAAVAVQLEPRLSQLTQYSDHFSPAGISFSWVETISIGQTANMRTFDQAAAMCMHAPNALHVLALREGKHMVSKGAFLGRVAVVGMAREGAVQLCRASGSPDPNTVSAYDKNAEVLLENVSISTDRDMAVASFHVLAQVTAWRCTFSSTSPLGMPVVAALRMSCITLNVCKITGCTSGGGAQAYDGGVMTLNDCHISNCKMSGFEGTRGGTLVANNCQVHNCGKGALFWRDWGASQLRGTTIFNNSSEGLLVSPTNPDGPGAEAYAAQGRKKPVLVQDCDIHHNKAYGVSLDGGSATLQGCRIFQNTFHGIIIKSAADAVVQDCEVFENSCGGLWLGLNGPGNVRVARCNFHHNKGEGLHDEYASASVKMKKALAAAAARGGAVWLKYTKPPITEGNVFSENGADNQHPVKTDRVCAFCNCKHPEAAQDGDQPSRMMCCAGCLTIHYCSTACQKFDWRNHKLDCKRIQRDCMILVTRVEPPGPIVAIYDIRNPDKLRQVPLPKTLFEKDGTVTVKVQSLENDPRPDQTLYIYDRTRQLQMHVRSPELFKFVTDKGTLGANTFTSKKVFCKATVAKGGNEMTILTSRLCAYQEW